MLLQEAAMQDWDQRLAQIRHRNVGGAGSNSAATFASQLEGVNFERLNTPAPTQFADGPTEDQY